MVYMSAVESLSPTDSVSVPTLDPEIQNSRMATKYIVVIFIIFAIVVAAFSFYGYSKYTGKPIEMFAELKTFYGTSFGGMSLALLIAFLVSDVVGSFNRYLMVPLVQSVFPGENVWQRPVILPRGKTMYPGLFFQSIVSFVMSIGVIFMVVYPLSVLFNFSALNIKRESSGISSTVGKVLFYIIVVVIIMGLFIWNMIEIFNPEINHSNVKTHITYKNPFGAEMDLPDTMDMQGHNSHEFGVFLPYNLH